MGLALVSERNVFLTLLIVRNMVPVFVQYVTEGGEHRRQQR